MHQGKLVFSQLMAYLPVSTFRRCVAKHRGDHKVKDFSCLDQFFAMAFAQLTYRESLRDIEVNLLYHMGFRCSTISRNTLCAPKTATSHASGREWSTSLVWSSGYGDLARCATAACKRT
jgi:hypothetical protein